MDRSCSTYGQTFRGQNLLGNIFVDVEGNIKTALRKIGCEGEKLIQLPQKRVDWRDVVNAVMSLRGP
jgi:hypothetical protein